MGSSCYPMEYNIDNDGQVLSCFPFISIISIFFYPFLSFISFWFEIENLIDSPVYEYVLFKYHVNEWYK